jgi:hypothetical protein
MSELLLGSFGLCHSSTEHVCNFGVAAKVCKCRLARRKQLRRGGYEAGVLEAVKVSADLRAVSGNNKSIRYVRGSASLVSASPRSRCVRHRRLQSQSSRRDRNNESREPAHGQKGPPRGGSKEKRPARRFGVLALMTQVTRSPVSFERGADDEGSVKSVAGNVKHKFVLFFVLPIPA